MFTDAAAIRRVSRGAYGNAYLLEVASAIAAHGKDKFTQSDIVKSTMIDKGLVAVAVRKLLAAGLVRVLPDEGRERPLFREVSVYWDNARRHHQELVDLPHD